MKRMCFTFTVQIMRRMPILMLYFWDHYSRLLESITRKTRKIHPVLWISGIISCMLGFIVCMFVFSMLMNHRSEESQVHSKIECLSKK